MKSIIQKLLGLLGYKISTLKDPVMDTPEFLHIYETCKPFTQTTKERMYALYKSVKYIVENNIEGDFVECGVWKGGSVMVMALTLLSLGSERKIYLYDTFQGMTPPTPEDHWVSDKNVLAKNEWSEGWSASSKDEVLKNLSSTGYPLKNFIFVEGKVEDTLPGTMPEKISILRLDTDWYESTKQELIHLFPKLKGVLIIDDYGAWAGSKKAVDDYFKGKILLNRIDRDSVIAQV